MGILKKNEIFEEKCKEYLNNLPVQMSKASLFLKYIGSDGELHYTVAEYFKNNIGSWVGTINGLFDFDFLSIREVIGFYPMEMVITAIDNSGLIMER